MASKQVFVGDKPAITGDNKLKLHTYSAALTEPCLFSSYVATSIQNKKTIQKVMTMTDKDRFQNYILENNVVIQAKDVCQMDMEIRIRRSYIIRSLMPRLLLLC